MHKLRKQRKRKCVLSADLLYTVLRASGHQRHAHPWILSLQENGVEAMLLQHLCVPHVTAYEYIQLKNGEFRKIPSETQIRFGWLGFGLHSRYSLSSKGELVDVGEALLQDLILNGV